MQDHAPILKPRPHYINCGALYESEDGRASPAGERVDQFTGSDVPQLKLPAATPEEDLVEVRAGMYSTCYGEQLEVKVHLSIQL